MRPQIPVYLFLFARLFQAGIVQATTKHLQIRSPLARLLQSPAPSRQVFPRRMICAKEGPLFFSAGVGYDFYFKGKWTVVIDGTTSVVDFAPDVASYVASPQSTWRYPAPFILAQIFRVDPVTVAPIFYPAKCFCHVIFHRVPEFLNPFCSKALLPVLSSASTSTM